MTTRWAPNALQVLHGQGELEVELWTNIPCHLTLRWTAIEPVKTLTPKEKRGALWYYDNKLCFVAWQDIEQLEAGDTTLHTFLWPGWTLGLSRWFIFQGTIAGDASPSNTAIFKATWEGATDMITLGKFTEVEVLLGNVKLKEGANITITRVDADNALEIAAVAGAAKNIIWKDDDDRALLLLDQAVSIPATLLDLSPYIPVGTTLAYLGLHIQPQTNTLKSQSTIAVWKPGTFPGLTPALAAQLTLANIYPLEWRNQLWVGVDALRRIYYQISHYGTINANYEIWIKGYW